MKPIEIVYFNNLRIGTFENTKYKSLNKDERNDLYSSVEKKIKEKDYNRKIFSLVIGCFLAVVAIVIMILFLCKVIDIGWLLYSFIVAGLVIVWALFYFLFGFIFYSKLKINYSFKSGKEVVNFASSNFKKYVDQYYNLLTYTTLYATKQRGKKKTLYPFCCFTPKKFKDIIFNGKISTNIPYYYISVESKRILFLPGITVIVDKKNSTIIPNENINVELVDNKYTLFNLDKPIIEFTFEGELPINFFYFKYEQKD